MRFPWDLKVSRPLALQLVRILDRDPKADVVSRGATG